MILRPLALTLFVSGASAQNALRTSEEPKAASVATTRKLDRTYVGSYLVSDGDYWTNDPPVYSCMDACADSFGGDSSDYACSTNGPDPSTVNHMAWVSGWAAGCNLLPEGFKLSPDGFYNCGSYGCSYSAYVKDHCGFSGGPSNYCFLRNQPPVCPSVVASKSWLPPNKKYFPVDFEQYPSDPEGATIDIQVTSCKSSEHNKENKGKGTASGEGPQVIIDGEGKLMVKAARHGHGKGRLYKIGYSATDDEGATCSGDVFVCIPHDASVEKIEEEDLADQYKEGPTGKMKILCPNPADVTKWYEQIE